MACLGWLAAQHPLLVAEKRSAWKHVWYEGSTPQIRNVLNEEDYSAPDWVELGRVTDYLRQRGVRDRELLCYSFSAVPLYTQLHVQPATRFVLLWSMIGYFRHHVKDMAREVAESPTRFVVNDFRMFGLSQGEAREVIPPKNQLTLKRLSAILQKKFPEQKPILAYSGKYPWSEPMVFHAGQYIVHEVRPRNIRGKDPLPLWWLK